MIKKLEKVLLFCEGLSDTAVISSILDRWCGFTYINEPQKENCFEIGSSRKEQLNWYKNKNYIFGICSVGGCTRYKQVYESIFKPHIADDDDIRKIIFITDADDNTEENIIKRINLTDLTLENGKWSKNTIINGFQENKTIETYLKIIPSGKCGAIESVLIESIKQKEPYIHNETVDFVDSLSDEARKYTNKKRFNLKLKLSIMLTLIDVEHPFKEYKDMFSNINIETDNIKENFGFLCDFK